MVIERTYNVPLRKGFIKKAKYKKTKKAVSVLKEFLAQHMKSDKIFIGKNLNQHLWKHGIKNPPHHVKITVIKEDDGTVKAELLGFKYDHKTKGEKEQSAKEEKKPAEKKKDKLEKKPAEKTVDKNIGVAVTDAAEKENPVEKKPKPKKVKKE
jgi:ribosomal protein L31E